MTKINHQKLFFRTAIITTFIFLIGVFFGSYVDELRSTDILDTLKESELDAQSYLTEKEFFDQFGSFDCKTASNRLSSLAEELGEVGYYLVSFERKSLFKQEDYDYLLRKYFLMQVRSYTLFNEMKYKCGSDYDLILFFFNPDDSLSERQGKILDAIVKEKKNLSVFSINVKYDGDILAENFRNYYVVDGTPTLIINEETRKEGFTSKEDLESIF